MNLYLSPQLPWQVAEAIQREQFSNDELEISEAIVRKSPKNSFSRYKMIGRSSDLPAGFPPNFIQNIFKIGESGNSNWKFHSLHIVGMTSE